MPTLIAGLISGTSADGIDVALTEFDDEARSPRVLYAETRPYPGELRADVGPVLSGDAVAPALLAALDARIGDAFADAVMAVLSASGTDPSAVSAIGSHGQTVGHFPGDRLGSTIQLGDPNRIAARTGIPVVGDFRRADMATGGQGAPLAPLFHAAAFASSDEPRAILNLGGIANLTLLADGRVTGFDTGPANTLLDAWVAHRGTGIRDDGGASAARGTVDETLLERLIEDPYFAKAPPKSTGREYFNLGWLEPRMNRGSRSATGDPISDADLLATLTDLSARTIADALAVHAPAGTQVYACGGGVHNGHLMARIAECCAVEVKTTDALSVDPDFVEAVGFAWLARERIHARSPVGLGDVTGARGKPVLGGIWLPPRI